MKYIKKLQLAAFVVISTLLFASCGANIPGASASGKPTASAGNSSLVSKTKETTVRKGMTKGQVVQVMGQPHRKSTYNGKETWNYSSGNQGEIMARGFAGNFIPVVGPLVAFAGAEVKNSTTSVTFTGSRVTDVTTMSNEAPVLRGAFANF